MFKSNFNGLYGLSKKMPSVIIRSPEPKAHGELIVYQSSRKSCEHASVFILIVWSSFLQISRTSIISGMSSKFGKIEPRTAELAALENSHRLIMGKCCDHSSSFIFN